MYKTRCSTRSYVVCEFYHFDILKIVPIGIPIFFLFCHEDMAVGHKEAAVNWLKLTAFQIHLLLIQNHENIPKKCFIEFEAFVLKFFEFLDLFLGFIWQFLGENFFAKIACLGQALTLSRRHLSPLGICRLGMYLRQLQKIFRWSPKMLAR